MKDKNKTITSFQSEIAKKLKINIKNHTRNLASAKIHDFVHKAIYPGSEIKKATKKQIKLGEKINLNLEIINIFWLSEYNILQIKFNLLI